MFVPGKPFQPSLMFVGNAGATAKWITFKALHSKVGSWSYPRWDLAGKASQEQTTDFRNKPLQPSLMFVGKVRSLP